MYRTQTKKLQNMIEGVQLNALTNPVFIVQIKDLKISGFTEIYTDYTGRYPNFILQNNLSGGAPFYYRTNQETDYTKIDDKCVLFVEYETFGDFAKSKRGYNAETASFYYGELNYNDTPSETGTYAQKRSKINPYGETIGTTWDSKIVVKNCYVYVGDTDRVKNTAYTLGIPYSGTGINFYSITGAVTEYEFELNGFVNVLSLIKQYANDYVTTNFNTTLSTLDKKNTVNISPLNFLISGSGIETQGIHSGFVSFTTPTTLETNPTVKYRFEYATVFDSVSDLSNFLNNFGIPWTYSETAAESIPVDNPDFNPDFLRNGQPENPTGGGDGNGDNSNDTVIPQGVVQIPASGIVNVWNIPLAEAVKLDSVLWNIDLVAQADKGLYTDIINAIVSLKFYPFTTSTSAESLVTVADTDLLYTDEGGSTYRVNGTQGAPREWCDFYIGEFFIEEYYGTSFDYAPYTKIDLFLPFIGYKKLDTNEVMNTLLKVRYQIDFLSGGVTALIYAGDKIVDTANGTIGIEIPLVSSNRATTETMYSLIKAANTMSTVSSIGALASGAATKNPVAAAGGAISLGQSLAGAARSQIAAGEYSVTKAGAVGDATSYYGVLEPYLIIERPITAYPKNLASLEGYPSNFGGKVSDFNGFLKCATTYLDGITATSTEIDEIDRFLKSGIFV